MCGYGKVAAAVQMPILSYMGHDVFNLPTMLISNTFPYGKYAVMESTPYIEDAISKWQQLGIHFDAITTGFIPSEKQARLVANYCRAQAAQGTDIFVDPVMGDYGKLYGGADEGTVRCMKEMLGVAHLCFPNYTEACLLTGETYREEGITQNEAYTLVDNNIQKLDTVDMDYIRRADRPQQPSYDVQEVIRHLKAFDGHVIIQTMFMQGDGLDNTGDEYIGPWLEAVKDIRPQQVMVYTIDRETPDKLLRKAPAAILDAIKARVEAAGIACSASY